MSILFNNTYKAFKKKGNFSGEFYSRPLSVAEARVYHETFDYGYEVNDVNDSGLFRLILLGNQYYTTVRVYCDNSIMNLGRFTIDSVYNGDGRELVFFDYGEGYSFYQIYAGNPGNYPAREISNYIQSNNLINISYEYDQDYDVLGTSVKIDRLENHSTIYYSFKYNGISELTSISFTLVRKVISTTTQWTANGPQQVTTTSWEPVINISEIQVDNSTSYTYQSSFYYNMLYPSQVYAINALCAFSNNTQNETRSAEFQVTS